MLEVCDFYRKILLSCLFYNKPNCGPLNYAAVLQYHPQQKRPLTFQSVIATSAIKKKVFWVVFETQK